MEIDSWLLAQAEYRTPDYEFHGSPSRGELLHAAQFGGYATSGHLGMDYFFEVAGRIVESPEPGVNAFPKFTKFLLCVRQDRGHQMLGEEGVLVGNDSGNREAAAACSARAEHKNAEKEKEAGKEADLR